MKYISLDLETTGIDPVIDQILQISMVVDDLAKPEVPVEDLPHFTAFIKHEVIIGNAFALGMNGWILDIISGRNKKQPPYPVLTNKTTQQLEDTGYCGSWLSDALEFMDKHFGDDKITVAGKNVAGFDIPFLPDVVKAQFRHRVLDVGPLYFNPLFDKAVPDLAVCKKRAGINTPVAHDAREDALDVIRLIRSKYYAN